MWIPLFVFTLIDGLVGRNPQSWAAPVRAGLVAALFFIGLVLIWRARIRLPIGIAILVSVLAALVIADIYQRVSFGISTWLIYAGAYALQCTIKRDWSRDFAIAGVALACLVLVTFSVQRPPPAMWNYNVLGGTLAVLLPSATTFRNRWRWIAPAIIAAGIICTTSRGAMVAASVGLAVIIQPWALMAAPALAVGLAIIMRRHEAMMRTVYWMQGIEIWRSSIWFGAGPGLQIPGLEIPDHGLHVHNTLLGLATQTGIVGLSIIAVTMALVRRAHFERWQLATFAAVAAHSMVDDPMCWLPTGVIVVLILASENGQTMRDKSVVVQD